MTLRVITDYSEGDDVEILVGQGRDDDDRRLYITAPFAEEPGIAAIYPCRECGWRRSCGAPPGEDCHS